MEMPWYKSKIIWGALISMTGKVLVLSGAINELTPETSQALTDTIVLLISGVGDLLAIGSRVTQKVAPAITLTKEK
jgi:hypothetical protein